MTYAPFITHSQLRFAPPRVRTIRFADIKDALAKGLDDFAAMPTHAAFLCLIYPIVGLIIGTAIFDTERLPLLYPVISGFALVGPLAAIGLYELSRRREQGLEAAWDHAFDVLHSPSRGAIAMLALMLGLIFVAWLVTAETIYWLSFGITSPLTFDSFVRDVFTTPAGWTLIVVGNLIGFVFALAVLSVSVVAFPLLIDRPLGAADAVLTSIRVVRKNPAMMSLWGLIVAAGLLVGSIPAFIGLAVTVPILGHATWHLYRKVIEPDATQVNNPVHHAPVHRSAADFPASLFATRDEEGADRR